MVSLSWLYSRYQHLDAAHSLFALLQVVVVALIANAALLLGRGLARKPVNLAVAVAAALLFGLKVSPFLVILAGAAAGSLLLRSTGTKSPGSPATGELFHGKPLLLLLALLAAGLAAAYAFDPTLFRLALTMLKIDCFAFGGGFAALPLMMHETVDVRSWLTGKAFMDGIALGQVTPGPIVITATFVGFMAAGLTGALVATVSIFAPSFLVLLITAPLFDRLKASPVFLGATRGAFATFLGLLIFMTVKFALLVPWDTLRVGVAFVSFGALLMKVDTFYIVLAGALLSLFLFR